ncbi:MAG: ABC transporter ATP-binding protein [Candidatus Paceibacterota bacterium]|jgi:branched-chain amino acid transport system ATP-binding protein
MSILSTQRLTKHFDGVYAVNKLSISFEAGKITGIIGPNGSGKSTLVNTLTGIIPIDSGEILVVGAERLQKVHAHEVPLLGITRTFQDVKLFEQMPVIDNILVVLTERSIWKSLFEKHGAFHLEKAEEVLKKVGLWEKRNELAKNLSYGQRKLLEIARVSAMIHCGVGDINIIFLDEPFAGLFPEMIKIVTGVMKEFRDQGKAVILIEHNMDLIRELSDYIYVLDSGELLAEGKPADVLVRKDVVEAYLGE